MRLALIEDPADELSQQAFAFARGMGEDVAPVAIDGAAPYAPAAWAQTLVELIERRAPSAVIAPGTDRGNELLAHVAAKLDLPMAANCVSVTPGEPATVVRTRWGGSLLEEARLNGSPLLLTSAAHVVAPEPIGDVETIAVSGAASELDRTAQVVEHVPAVSSGVSLAEADVVVSGG